MPAPGTHFATQSPDYLAPASPDSKIGQTLGVLFATVQGENVLQLDLFTLVSGGAAVENSAPVNELTQAPESGVGFAGILQSASRPVASVFDSGVPVQGDLPSESVLSLAPPLSLTAGERRTPEATLGLSAGNVLPVALPTQSPENGAEAVTAVPDLPPVVLTGMEQAKDALQSLEAEGQQRRRIEAVSSLSSGDANVSVAEITADMPLDVVQTLNEIDEAVRADTEAAQAHLPFAELETSNVQPLSNPEQPVSDQPEGEVATGSAAPLSNVMGTRLSTLAAQTTQHSTSDPALRPTAPDQSQARTPQPPPAQSSQPSMPDLSRDRMQAGTQAPSTTLNTTTVPAPAVVERSTGILGEPEVIADEAVLVPRAIAKETTSNGRETFGSELINPRERYAPVERVVSDLRVSPVPADTSNTLVMERLLQAEAEPKASRPEQTTALLTNSRPDAPQPARTVPVLSSTVDVWVRTPADLPEQVMQQVNRLHADALRMSASGGDFLQRVTLNLWPQELGPIEVQLRGADQVNVSFNAREATTRELLEQGVARLRQLFDEQGLSLGDVDVGSDWSAQAGEETDRQNTDAGFSGEGLAELSPGDEVTLVGAQRNPSEGDNSLYIVA